VLAFFPLYALKLDPTEESKDAASGEKVNSRLKSRLVIVSPTLPSGSPLSIVPVAKISPQSI
jgi:hypothetical protein